MYNPIQLPGPGNGRPLNAQGLLAHLLIQAQGHQLPMPVRQAPNMNAIHQQVSQLANKISQSRLTAGQAKPYQALPQGGFGPALPHPSNPFLQLLQPPQQAQQGMQDPNVRPVQPQQAMEQQPQPFGPGSPGFFVPGFHQLPTPLHSFPYYQ